MIIRYLPVLISSKIIGFFEKCMGFAKYKFKIKTFHSGIFSFPSEPNVYSSF